MFDNESKMKRLLYFGKVNSRGFIKENKARKRNHIILFKGVR
jgi:hypothetical protein